VNFLCEKLRSQEIEQAFTRKSDPVFLLRSDPALAREELSFRTSQISFCQPPTSQSGGTSRAVQLPKLSPANGVLDCKQKKEVRNSALAPSERYWTHYHRAVEGAHS